MGMFSSFRPVKLRMTPASLTFTTGFVLDTDVFSFFLWRKPQPRNTETSTTYNTATEISMHFACIPQNLSMIIIRPKKSIAFRNNLLSPNIQKLLCGNGYKEIDSKINSKSIRLQILLP